MLIAERKFVVWSLKRRSLHFFQDQDYKDWSPDAEVVKDELQPPVEVGYGDQVQSVYSILLI